MRIGIGSTCVLMALGCSAASFGGPIVPPLGPVQSTGKTLTEIEPRIAINATNTPGDANSVFRITQAGSYYLTGNVAGQAGKHGIEVAVPGVTIDLMGFEVVGVPTSLQGVFVELSTPGSFAIRNGTIRNWTGSGLGIVGKSAVVSDVILPANSSNGLSASAGSHCVITRCRADNNVIGFNIEQGVIRDSGAHANTGIGIAIVSGSVIDCTTISNGGWGIYANNNCLIKGCTSNFNSLDGISCFDGCTILDCVAGGNLLSGIRPGGDAFGNGVTISRCTAFGNTVDGFAGRFYIKFSDCAAHDNQGNGFRVGPGSTFTNCTSSDNALAGFSTGAGSTFLNCNSKSNTGIGFSVGDNSSLTSCLSDFNGTDGILGLVGISVRSCTSSNNGSNGISVGARARIENNLCTSNGRVTADGAAILVTGNDGVIDGNHCTTNDFGVRITGAGNIVVRNTCQGNPSNNFSIVVNNRVAALVAPPFSGAVNGNSGGAGVGGTDPYANMAY